MDTPCAQGLLPSSAPLSFLSAALWFSIVCCHALFPSLTHPCCHIWPPGRRHYRSTPHHWQYQSQALLVAVTRGTSSVAVGMLSSPNWDHSRPYWGQSPESLVVPSLGVHSKFPHSSPTSTPASLDHGEPQHLCVPTACAGSGGVHWHLVMNVSAIPRGLLSSLCCGMGTEPTASHIVGKCWLHPQLSLCTFCFGIDSILLSCTD